MVTFAMAKIWRVDELMSEIMCVIDHTSTISEVATSLSELHVTGAPVVDGEQILGVVSRSDLLNVIDSSRPVTEVMSSVVFAVRPEDPALLAIRMMVEERIHRVVVVNAEGKLHGIVTAMDVMKALLSRGQPGLDVEYVDLLGPTKTST